LVIPFGVVMLDVLGDGVLRLSLPEQFSFLGWDTCKCPAIQNRRRCLQHGGKTTGPKTTAGLERSRRGRYPLRIHEARSRRRALWHVWPRLLTQ
jgi:hypothetical protein